MKSELAAKQLLLQEARALLTRLARLKPLALSESMVPAAAISRDAQAAVDFYLVKGRAQLRSQLGAYLEWLRSEEGRQESAAVAQRRFTMLRLRFNTVLAQLDIFAEALTQRSETSTGVWLAGLDAISADALTLPGDYYDAPPLICYLIRGQGAAIRRARTRLPGGGECPIGIVMVPRERMIGSGLASSLVHEVGHQAAALLDLVQSVRAALREKQSPHSAHRDPWSLWDRWISEIIPDLWAVAKVGVGGALGLIAAVSMPSAFVFSVRTDDPHPPPWLRVKVSCALGNKLYPHPQWEQVSRLWEALYPLESNTPEKARFFRRLEESIPDLAELIVEHRTRTLRGNSLGEILADPERRPEPLSELFSYARKSGYGGLREVAPTMALAAISQARAEQALTPEEESRLLASLLTDWALQKSLSSPCIEKKEAVHA